MEEFVRNGMDNPLSSVERRHSQKHILEVSAAQQRQQELLHQRRGSEKSAGSHRSHQHSVDEKDKTGLSSRLRAQVPSATFVNYDTFKISQMNIDDNGGDNTHELASQSESAKCQHDESQDAVEDNNVKKDSQHAHRHHHTHSGRKSRMAMHDSDDDDGYGPKQERPDFVKDPHAHKPPRVSSAKGGGEEMNSAIQSIKDLRQSLVSTASNSNLSSTAGNYIKRLLKQELRQADEEIDELTATLEKDIDEKQKQYEVMLELQEQKTFARGKEDTSKSEIKFSDKTASKSAPVSVNKTKETVDRSDRISSASGKPKKESLVPKPIRTHTNSTASTPTSSRIVKEVATRVPAESGKFLDSYYSLPNSKLKVETNQRSRKLQEVEGPSININASLKDTVAKVNKGINTTPRRVGEPIPNAVVTDLTQVQSQYNQESQRQAQIRYPSNNNNNAQSSSAVPFNRSSTNSLHKERTSEIQYSNSGRLEIDRSASSSSIGSQEDNSLAEPRSWSVTNEPKSERESVPRVKSARNSNRQVVGKRLVYKAKYPKRHYPVMHLLKVEGATCAPSSTQNQSLYVQSPRSSTCSTQISPPIETVPTKISLMITHDHEETRFSGGQFLPMSRSVRGPLHKSAQMNPRRK